MGNSSADDREFPRKEMYLGILFKHEMEWFPADIRDVTIGGLSFITSEKFVVGSKISVFFGDSSDIGNNDVDTVVVRSQPLESYSPLKYLVAVKLAEPNDKYVKDVQAYLKERDAKSA